MSFQSAPDMAEAVIQANFAGVQMANVLNFHQPGGYNQANIDQLATLVDNQVGAIYLAGLHTGMAYTGTLSRGLTSSIDLTGFDNTNAGAGTAAGGAVPNNISLCATLRTGHTGRSARGRFFALPTGLNNTTSGNSFVTGLGTIIENFLNAVIIDALAAGWIMVVLSRRNNGVLRSVAIGTPISQVEIRNLLVDSQRGRMIPGH